ncbi:MgtC/SapB family protein [Bacillus atrophaeus]|uniref:MgtC/SapB family protein n=1 Tax=Bacillus atrophaeus TaxID=1452 RepID=UPI001C101D4C|nr:MgtC/SapB family protein [Bacillus atrophaeus]MBU5264425.1 MgtC/SapB family protein [Bacillus atrophaeus]
MDIDFVIRLAVAGFLGALIGLEREFRAKEAGLRTHFLVAVGSALMMLVSKYGFSDIIQNEHTSLDPSRVAAQVVSGVGFLGAGTIILQRHIVRGLTTAAGIWATSGIGLTIGAGMYVIGISGTILALIGLELLNVLFKSISTHSLFIGFDADQKDSIYKILEHIEAKGILTSSYEIKNKTAGDQIIYAVEVKGKAKNKSGKVELIKTIQSIPHILSVKVE